MTDRYVGVPVHLEFYTLEFFSNPNLPAPPVSVVMLIPLRSLFNLLTYCNLFTFNALLPLPVLCTVLLFFVHIVNISNRHHFDDNLL